MMLARKVLYIPQQYKTHTEIGGLTGVPDDTPDPYDEFLAMCVVDQVEEHEYDALFDDLRQETMVDEVHEDQTDEIVGNSVTDTLAQSNEATGRNEFLCV